VTLWADLRSGEKLGAFCLRERAMKKSIDFNGFDKAGRFDIEGFTNSVFTPLDNI
jgi:hypothetical protein